MTFEYKIECADCGEEFKAQYKHKPSPSAISKYCTGCRTKRAGFASQTGFVTGKKRPKPVP